MWPDPKYLTIFSFFYTRRHLRPGVGRMWPWTFMCMREILPLTLIAQSLAISKNLLMFMSCMSQWQWPRNVSSESASSFARSLGTYDKKPMIWFIRFLRIRQWAMCKLWSGLKCFIEGWTSVENDECSGKPSQAGTKWWLTKRILSCWMNRE